MATADSVKAKIQGLIDQSNAATGNTDADLTTAVNSLIAGFGQGGGGGVAIPGVIEIAHGSFVPASDVSVMSIEHGMSERPQLCAIWTNHISSAQYVYLVGAFLPDGNKPTTSNMEQGSYTVATGGTDTLLWGSNANTRGAISSADETSIFVTEGTTTKYFTAGATYYWVALALECGGGA